MLTALLGSQMAVPKNKVNKSKIIGENVILLVRKMNDILYAADGKMVERIHLDL